MCRRIRKDERGDVGDAQELVIASRLMDVVRDIDKVRRAMSMLNSRGVSPSRGLAVVWDEEMEAAHFFETDEQIGAAIRHGRSVRVISVGSQLLDVLQSLERLAADRRAHPD